MMTGGKRDRDGERKDQDGLGKRLRDIMISIERERERELPMDVCGGKVMGGNYFLMKEKKRV